MVPLFIYGIAFAAASLTNDITRPNRGPVATPPIAFGCQACLIRAGWTIRAPISTRTALLGRIRKSADRTLHHAERRHQSRGDLECESAAQARRSVVVDFDDHARERVVPTRHELNAAELQPDAKYASDCAPLKPEDFGGCRVVRGRCGGRPAASSSIQDS
jgi:hypothetical protein